MAKAGDLVRTCVLAGYTKIHLDTSMRCADDPGGAGSPLSEKTATERAAFLCEIAEDAYASLPPGSPAPLYVIGTEVPVPGGEQEESHIRITRTEDLQRTIELTRRAFESRGLSSRMAACDCGRRSARRRIRRRDDRRIRSPEGARAVLLHQDHRQPGLRGSFDGLPDPSCAAPHG